MQFVPSLLSLVTTVVSHFKLEPSTFYRFICHHMVGRIKYRLPLHWTMHSCPFTLYGIPVAHIFFFVFSCCQSVRLILRFSSKHLMPILLLTNEPAHPLKNPEDQLLQCNKTIYQYLIWKHVISI